MEERRIVWDENKNAENRRNPAPVIALRLMPDVLAKYKAQGKGYTGIMADVLNYVADNPEILSKIRT